MEQLDLRDLGQRAKQAGRQLGLLSTNVRNTALLRIAAALETPNPALQAANEADLADARAANGSHAAIAPALLDRLTLTPKRIRGMAEGCRDVAALPDPLGETFGGKTLPNGLRLAKRRVPLGVLAVIFESRPNVTTEIGSLCIKTGNAVIMRGGKESLRTNSVLVDLIRAALVQSGAPADAVQLITSTDRALVPQLLGMDDVIDLVIPRGSQGLQNLVREHARMPVIFGGIGVCHLFVDETADLAKSVEIVYNAKTQAPSVCNALDTILVHRAVLDAFMPLVAARLIAGGVTLYCDEPALAVLRGQQGLNQSLIDPALPEHYGKEFLSLALSVKVVDSLDEAIAHIGRYGTNHSDGILTNDYANANAFLDQVDSAAVYVNASTRFTDGGQFGLGAEVAISTQRLHARGPMGLVELTTYKWIVQGDWHVRP